MEGESSPKHKISFFETPFDRQAVIKQMEGGLKILKEGKDTEAELY